MTKEELLEEIDRNRKWLCDAGYTAYNIDVAFASIYRKVKELEQEPCVTMRDLSDEEIKHFAEEMKKVRVQVVEQRPCEDAVSRKAVLNLARDLDFSKVKGLEHYKHRCIEVEDVEELASVTPDLSSLREINDALTKRVQYLEKMERYAMPGTPIHRDRTVQDFVDKCRECGRQKTGKWIRVDHNKVKCSKCEITHLIAQYPHGAINFCPNCGSRNEVE